MQANSEVIFFILNMLKHYIWNSGVRARQYWFIENALIFFYPNWEHLHATASRAYWYRWNHCLRDSEVPFPEWKRKWDSACSKDGALYGVSSWGPKHSVPTLLSHLLLPELWGEFLLVFILSGPHQSQEENIHTIAYRNSTRLRETMTLRLVLIWYCCIDYILWEACPQFELNIVSCFSIFIPRQPAGAIL